MQEQNVSFQVWFRSGNGLSTSSFGVCESPSGCQRRFGILSLVRARFGLPGGLAGRQEARTGRLRRLFGRSEGLVDNVFLFHGGQVLGLDCNGFAGNYIFHGLIGNPWWLLSGGDEPGPSQTIDKSLLGSPWRIKAWRLKIWTTGSAKDLHDRPN